MPEVTQPASITSPKPTRWPWLLVIYVVLALLLDWFLVENAWWLRNSVRLNEGVLVGNVFGQMAMAVMLGGLWGRTWLAGWLLTTGLVICGLTFVFLSPNGLFGSDQWGILCLIPLMSLAACLPFLLLRGLMGWSLTRTQQLEVPRSEHRVEDLFVFSIAVACSIALTKLSFVPITGTNGIEMAGLVWAMISAMLIVPVTIVTFTFRTWSRRLVGYLLIILASAISMAVFSWVVVAVSPANTIGSLAGWWNILIDILSVFPLCILVWLAGIVATVASGYRLTHHAAKAPSTFAPDADPLDEDEPEKSVNNIGQRHWHQRFQSQARRQARWLTLGVVCATVLSVLAASAYDSYELSLFRALAKPQQYFQAPVAQIDMRGRAVVGIKMAASATAEDIARIAQLAPQLERLSLAGTKIGDNDIPLLNRFPKLLHLDLSNTAITGQGLQNLKEMRSLSLADTRVTFQEAIDHVQLHLMDALDLSGLNITDDQLEIAPPLYSVTRLNLARNPITDRGVSEVLTRCTALHLLDLSDTKVSGQSLQSANCPAMVKLDGTEISDAVLGKLLADPTWPCQRISLRRTKITAAMLVPLNARGIALGEGVIKEADLLALTAASYPQLSLNGPEFTGQALATGKIMVQELDLSGSAVTDEIASQFFRLGWIQHMVLSHTNITAQGIQRLNSSTVDLRHSKVNTTDLLQLLPSLPYGQIILRHETVSPEQRIKLRHQRILMDMSPFDYFEF